MRLLLKYYLERPLFEKEQLDALQQLIDRQLPTWALKLKVGKDEDSLNAQVVTQEKNLFQVANEVSPVKFGLGSMVISGSYNDLIIFVNSCRSTLPPELNHFSIEIVNRQMVEKQLATEWAQSFFLDALKSLPIRYAKAHLANEFDAKNMVKTQNVIKAIGVKLDETLPGLYWLNFFGLPYVKMLGKRQLLTSPAYQVLPVAEGVLVALGKNPAEWEELTYQEQERQVITHLGKQFFFSKEEPERKTIAPDFRSELKSRI